MQSHFVKSNTDIPMCVKVYNTERERERERGGVRKMEFT